ncbi:hypothetical protein F4775DRAFT_431009 [Biscogniauxia sp. FL1348]|nr:hypothetical protein F4775DRAFT_431009 [Biscogniauxia sp. FL1348]
MALPYQCLTPLGKSSLLCAARGTNIYTFDLDADSQVLSSWNHPLTRQSENGKAQVIAQENKQPKESESEQPPSKKRRLDSDDKPKTEAVAEEEASQQDAAGTSAHGQKKQKPKPAPPRPEIPFVILLTATNDGSHVVAATGDKVVWVFEHSGQGVLKESSQRSMPKRPSSISLTDDGKTILCADKFGDVYALPLTPAPSGLSANASASTAAAPLRPSAPKGANTLTVHSQRNLRALEEQRKVREKREKAGVQSQPLSASSSAAPEQQHDLLLGHVSMLTAVAAATLDGRPYILTADRDEHIRVSRGIPQAHVVETYCLGHEAFLSALCVVPPRAPGGGAGHLVSGGGDPALFLWDWRAGRLLGTTDLLGPVREVSPGATKLAVSRLRSCDTEHGCYIVAVCERVPALFIYQLTTTTTTTALAHVQTLRLSGNPLDVAVIGHPDKASRLVVSVDAEEPIRVFSLDGGSWRPQGCVQVQGAPPLPPAAEASSPDLSRPELDKLLYTVENLRKTSFDDEAEEEEQEQEQGQEQGRVGSEGSAPTPAPAPVPE